MAKFLPRNLDKAWKRLASGAGADNLKSLVLFQNNPGYTVYWDDFVGQGAGTWPASQNWSYPATQGTGTEVLTVTTAQLGGHLSIATGTSTGDTAIQTVGLHWRGTEGWYYINRAKISTLSSSKFEVGVIDALTRVQAINAKSTPTFIATDAACFIFDTTEDTALTFITVNNGVVGSNNDVTFTMDTAMHVYELLGSPAGFVSGWVDGIQAGGSGAITVTAPLSPYACAVARTTASVALSVDYMGMVGPKFA